MAGKIYETSEYGRFTLHEINRSIDSVRSQKRIEKIKRSMRKYGFLDAYPLFCVKNGGKFRIKAGHHRYIAAKELGIAIKYVVGADNISLFEIEDSTGMWVQQDVLYSNVRQRLEPYLIVDNYAKKTGIPLGSCIGLLGGGLASSNNKGKAFKAGTYKVVNTDRAHAVGDIVIYLRSIGIPWAANSLLVNAIAKVLFVPQVDCDFLKKKLKSGKALIRKQPNTASYLSMIEEIYNYRNQKNKIPLAFLADEEARKRRDKLFAK